MTDNRIRAYIQLIQKLLDCPEGEEVEILRQNEDLVDAQFIYILEQAAARAEKEGEEDAASFLGDLAQQLQLAFGQATEMMNPDRSDRTQAYIQLIEGILACERGEDVALLLDNNSDLVDRGFVQVLAQIAQMLTENGKPDSAAFLINMATEISAVIEEG
ncbi:hypothetical protein [Laspinema palackyanum]|uniref:hypothetical protein n=1 Tax=Laspinema palackyanum TaxID=3231601 RepID=UPI00345D2126|nr:hypothetical protein [Laspinema sp. D2c]